MPADGSSPKRRGRVRGWHVVLSALILGLLVGSPFAVAAGTGDPIIGGERNPSNNQSKELTRETQIIGDIDQNEGGIAANTGGYVTRQSNKSDSGGGAIYGCRAKKGTESCVAANNLADGNAFRFQASASADQVGLFRFGVDIDKLVDKAPFATNGTATVKNLSADKIDGKDSTDFYTKDEANKAFVPQGSLLYAVVDANASPVAVSGRGATAVSAPAANANGLAYTVTFGTANVSGCAYNATIRDNSVNSLPLVSAAPDPDNKSNVIVQEQLQGGGAPAGADFSLTVTC